MVIERGSVAVDRGIKAFRIRNKTELIRPDTVGRRVGTRNKHIGKLSVAMCGKCAEQNAHADHAAVEMIVRFMHKFQ